MAPSRKLGRKRKSTEFNFQKTKTLLTVFPCKVISGFISQSNARYGELKNTHCTSNSLTYVYQH